MRMYAAAGYTEQTATVRKRQVFLTGHLHGGLGWLRDGEVLEP